MFRILWLAWAAIGAVVLTVSALLAVGCVSVAVIVMSIVGLLSGVGGFIGLAIRCFRRSA